MAFQFSRFHAMAAKTRSFRMLGIDDGRLAKMGLAADKYPAPTMALINPQTKEIEVIGSGILTEDTILERVFVITQIPVGERY
jgi:conjugal transfer pilus assembly protein TraF